MARAGMIDEDMAKELGVAISTFYKWKNDHPEFKKALTIGKKEPDDAVAAALFLSATGQFYDEVTEIKEPFYDKKGTIGERVVQTRTVRKYIPPHTTAGIFWMKNRDPDNWRDKQEVDLALKNVALDKFVEGLNNFRLEDAEHTDTEAGPDS